MQFKRLRLYTSTPFQYNDQNSLDNPTFDTWGSFNDLAFRRAGHLVAEVPWDKLGWPCSITQSPGKVPNNCQYTIQTNMIMVFNYFYQMLSLVQIRPFKKKLV
jgi:hypothetical protein